MSITLTALQTGIRNTFLSIPQFKQFQTLGTITESIPQFPLLQIYMESIRPSLITATSTLTFQTTGVPRVYPKEVEVYIDIYGRQRSHIGEDLVQLYPLVDAVIEVLEAQTGTPYFGVEGVRGFTYKGEKTLFTYASVLYIGFRFTLTIYIL